ncbi:MAG: hypothetical protein M5R42_15225, partial [Rhodocyclaceae bacterium]|nr:hypothetical protein [Rhodocyclaceae bacterium]
LLRLTCNWEPIRLQYLIVFSVDLFNEGVDLPEIDTVVMLRPTESKILFLQQLGRGLEKIVQVRKAGRSWISSVTILATCTSPKHYLEFLRTLKRWPDSAGKSSKARSLCQRVAMSITI